MLLYNHREGKTKKKQVKEKTKKKKKTLDKLKKICYNKNVKRKRKLLQIKKLG